MARFAASLRTTGAGTNLLPSTALVGATTVRPRVAEVGVFNTTATEVAVGLVRLTTAGTPGASISIGKESDTAQAPLVVARDTYTSTGPTITAGVLRQATLGAAKGSGVIWTFGPVGLVIPDVAAAAVALIVPTGTGQIVDVYWVWDE
jgi:hypothetical protein